MSEGISLPPNKRFYKVALSFTSANREYVKKVAEVLNEVHKIDKLLIFFDEWSSLNGSADADLKLAEIYGQRSELIIPFFSNEYLSNYWTKVEFKPIRTAATDNPDKLIPARFGDEFEIDGFPKKNNIFINCHESTEIEVAQQIFEKIGQRSPDKLVHVNEIVKGIEKSIPDWGIDYIELRDFFSNLTKSTFPAIKLEKYIHRWEYSDKKFIKPRLHQKKPVNVLDDICEYGDSDNYLPLLKFLCVLIHDIPVKGSDKIKALLKEACRILNIEDDELCGDKGQLKPPFIEATPSLAIGEAPKPDFPFTNREKELEDVLGSPYNYQLVTAPVGYGKSTFLKRLAEVYDKNGFITHYIKITNYNNIRNTDDICLLLGFKNVASFLNNVLSANNGNKKKIKDKGIVFLIVSSGVVAERIKLLKELIEILRGKIKIGLETEDKDYPHPDKNTKLIVSSRQLFGDPRNSIKWPYGFEEVRLSEFSYDVILKSLKESLYWGDKTDEDYESLVAKLTLLTAGHPGAVSMLANSYKTSTSVEVGFDVLLIRDFIQDISSRFNSSINDPEVSDLFLKKTILLYRYISVSLLSDVTGNSRIKMGGIINSLLSHGLYRKVELNNIETQLLKDSLLRRTCAIDFCYNRPADFYDILNKAKDFYNTLLKDQEIKIEYKILWLIEFWFSHLQGKLLSFSYTRSTYTEKVVSEINFTSQLLLFIKQCEKSELDYCKKQLLNRLDQDWEFQLLLNFIPYRPDFDCYAKDGYGDLLKIINDTFNSASGSLSHE